MKILLFFYKSCTIRQGKGKSLAQRQYLWAVNKTSPCKLFHQELWSGSVLIFLIISFPLDHLYYRTRKHSPYNMINPIHIHISTAWSQHSGRDSLGLCSAGSCECPHSPVPWSTIAQGNPGGTGGTAILPWAALVMGNTCRSVCRSTLKNLGSVPKPSCPSHPAWAPQQEGQGLLSINSAWASSLSQVWGKDVFLGSQRGVYSFIMKYILPRVLFKHSQTSFLKSKMSVTAFSPYHILLTYEFKIICVLKCWGRGGAGIGTTVPFLN